MRAMSGVPRRDLWSFAGMTLAVVELLAFLGGLYLIIWPGWSRATLFSSVRAIE